MVEIDSSLWITNVASLYADKLVMKKIYKV